VSVTVEQELVRSLKRAHGLETQAISLLEKGSGIAGDDEIGAIYRAHLMQTKEHERYVAERLGAHGESPSKSLDVAMQASALGLGALTQVAPDTPVRLAMTAFAFEHLEIAAYRMLARLAQRAGDAETVAVAERILEQEEAAAELVAGTFDRAIERTLGEPRLSPVPGVTPLVSPPTARPRTRPRRTPGRRRSSTGRRISRSSRRRASRPRTRIGGSHRPSPATARGTCSATTALPAIRRGPPLRSGGRTPPSRTGRRDHASRSAS
jgi:ferritin-like metal-binding protein YciE